MGQRIKRQKNRKKVKGVAFKNKYSNGKPRGNSNKYKKVKIKRKR